MKRLGVLLADDHETVRQGVRVLIDGQDDMRVVAEAVDGRTAVESCAAAKPDVVVLDVSMPGMNGLAAARALIETTSHPAIVAFTRHDDDGYVQELLKAGASGYVLKQSSSQELLRAIRAAARGEQHIDGALIARAAKMPDSPLLDGNRGISNRETEVLRLMAVGHSNKEIAAKLNLSVKTVEVHKANAGRKLGLHGRIDFIKYAVLRGWLTDP